MQRTGAAEHHARGMIAIETGASGGHVVLADKCPPDLVPFFVRTTAERDRWQSCWELSLKMLGGEYLAGGGRCSPGSYTTATSRPADHRPSQPGGSGH